VMNGGNYLSSRDPIPGPNLFEQISAGRQGPEITTAEMPRLWRGLCAPDRRRAPRDTARGFSLLVAVSFRVGGRDE
jgi:hypothetical protein